MQLRVDIGIDRGHDLVHAARALFDAATAAGVPMQPVGRFGGDMVRLGGSEAPLSELSSLYRGAFAAAVGLE